MTRSQTNGQAIKGKKLKKEVGKKGDGGRGEEV